MAVARAHPKHQSVLVVEGTLTLAMDHARLLNEGGFEAAAVASGTEAIERLSRERFDVIVTDASLPGLDGLSHVRRFRERDATSIVIVLVEQVANSLLVQAMDAGAQQVLVKPISPESLLEAVRVAVRHRRTEKRRGPGRLTVSATAAKNEFAHFLEVASREPVVITKHEEPRAVLLSFEEWESLNRSAGARLERLTQDFDALLAKMQTAEARRGIEEAFDAGPEELGRAAVTAAKKRG